MIHSMKLILGLIVLATWSPVLAQDSAFSVTRKPPVKIKDGQKIRFIKLFNADVSMRTCESAVDYDLRANKQLSPGESADISNKFVVQIPVGTEATVELTELYRGKPITRLRLRDPVIAYRFDDYRERNPGPAYTIVWRYDLTQFANCYKVIK